MTTKYIAEWFARPHSYNYYMHTHNTHSAQQRLNEADEKQLPTTTKHDKLQLNACCCTAVDD